MKVRMLFREIQEIPADKWEEQKAFEHRSDLLAVKLGLPLPTRYRPFTGNMDSRIRVHEREYESIADLTRLHTVWKNNPECQQLDEEWARCYSWERRELFYVDDPNDPTMPWLQMAAEQGRTVRYVVNPDYKMPKEQENYKG